MKYCLTTIFCITVMFNVNSQQFHNIETKQGGKMSIASYLVDTIISIKDNPVSSEIIFQHIDSSTVYVSPFKSILLKYLKESISDSIDYFFVYNPTSDSIIYYNTGNINCYEFAVDNTGNAKIVEFYVSRGCGIGIWPYYLTKNQLLIFYDNNKSKNGNFRTKAKLMLRHNCITYKSNTFYKSIDTNIFYIDKTIYNIEKLGVDLDFFVRKLYLPDGNKFIIDGIER